MKLNDLAQGFRFSQTQLVLDAATIARYVAAVEDDSPLFLGEGALVPPLAVLALAMRDLVELIAAHPGILHLSQKVAIYGTVPVGTAVTTQLVVQSVSRRRGNLLLTLEAQVDGAEGRVLLGTLLLLVPPAAEDAHG